MARERFYGGPLWFLKWWVILMLATLVIDCLYVMWPYPHGGAGLGTFKDELHQEWGVLVPLTDERFPKLAYGVYDAFHTVLFKWPGFDYMISRAHDPTPMDSGGEMMRRAVLSTDTFWGTALVGLQLFCTRLAVLIICAPLVALTSVGAFVDGLLTWYRRRTGVGRESGFIYHRAKRHAAHFLLALCFVYLAAPTTVDPRVAITSFAIIFAIAVFIAVANFKKYL